MASHSHQQFTPCPTSTTVCTRMLMNWCWCNIRRSREARCKVTSEPAAVSPTHVNTSSSNLNKSSTPASPSSNFLNIIQKNVGNSQVSPRLTCSPSHWVASPILTRVLFDSLTHLPKVKRWTCHTWRMSIFSPQPWCNSCICKALHILWFKYTVTSPGKVHLIFMKFFFDQLYLFFSNGHPHFVNYVLFPVVHFGNPVPFHLSQIVLQPTYKYYLTYIVLQLHIYYLITHLQNIHTFLPYTWHFTTLILWLMSWG